MESFRPTLKGIFRDVLVGKDGRRSYDSGWTSNTIVDRGRVLLASFLRNDSSSGIQYLGVGQGLSDWDADGTPSPDETSIDLVDRFEPTIPVANLNIAYLDAGDAVVDGPTTRLQITATLEAGYPEITAPAVSYPLREFGLFGSYDGGDFMINYVRHGVIHKDASSTLIRVIRLYF